MTVMLPALSTARMPSIAKVAAVEFPMMTYCLAYPLSSKTIA